MRSAPRALAAGSDGKITERPGLAMLADRGGRLFTPRWDELTPLPDESDLFFLPGRRALGWSEAAGEIEETDCLAVAAFAAPGYTLSAHSAYREEDGAEPLPFFAYGAVGYARGKFWICATRVDRDRRQVFANVSEGRIERDAGRLLINYPRNRLIRHIIENCVRRYSCPAAKNFALGRYEAPLPTARTCGARCVGCVSQSQEGGPGATTPQCRLEFTPTADEIAEVMRVHAAREKARPIFSFGQGCEGDPLVNAGLLTESVSLYRSAGGRGTINCNTNASNPGAVESLARAGLTSLRVSLNSARPELYKAYYRPVNYDFDDVRESIAVARKNGIFVSLNLLYFPGITDSEDELDALARLCAGGVAMIQWRNLNIDPRWHRDYLGAAPRPLGLNGFMARLKEKCPWLRYGYFNPWLGDKAEIVAPDAGRRF